VKNAFEETAYAAHYSMAGVFKVHLRMHSWAASKRVLKDSTKQNKKRDNQP
jgi:hypothetical protein